MSLRKRVSCKYDVTIATAVFICSFLKLPWNPLFMMYVSMQLRKCSGAVSYYISVLEQLVSLRQQLVNPTAQLWKCSCAVTKVFVSSYESAPEQLISLPEELQVFRSTYKCSGPVSKSSGQSSLAFISLMLELGSADCLQPWHQYASIYWNTYASSVASVITQTTYWVQFFVMNVNILMKQYVSLKICKVLLVLPVIPTDNMDVCKKIHNLVAVSIPVCWMSSKIYIYIYIYIYTYTANELIKGIMRDFIWTTQNGG